MDKTDTEIRFMNMKLKDDDDKIGSKLKSDKKNLQAVWCKDFSKRICTHTDHYKGIFGIPHVTIKKWQICNKCLTRLQKFMIFGSIDLYITL